MTNSTNQDINISRPTMMSVLTNANVRGLSHMNKKQMWKLIEEKGLVEKVIELGKKQDKTHNSRVLEVTDLETNETKYFPSLTEAGKYYDKCCTYFTYYSERVCKFNGKR